MLHSGCQEGQLWVKSGRQLSTVQLLTLCSWGVNKSCTSAPNTSKAAQTPSYTASISYLEYNRPHIHPLILLGFNVKTDFQEDLDYFLPFLKSLFSFQCEHSCPFEILSSVFIVFCVGFQQYVWPRKSHFLMHSVLSCFQLQPVSCCSARNLPSAEWYLTISKVQISSCLCMV